MHIAHLIVVLLVAVVEEPPCGARAGASLVAGCNGATTGSLRSRLPRLLGVAGGRVAKTVGRARGLGLRGGGLRRRRSRRCGGERGGADEHPASVGVRSASKQS